MRWTDTRRVALLLALGGFLHFFRLAEPRRVVFDEVHFGGFVNAYVATGSYFFDIHPPHAKLLAAAAAAAGGYRGAQDFAELGAPIDQVSPALLRLLPALAGSLVPVVLFLLMRQLGASPAAALLAGAAAVFDNALLIQTRILALDGVLLVAGFGSLCAFLAALGATGRLRRTAAALGAGALAGLAAGTKFTGLSALALIGVWLAVDFLRRPGWLRLRGAASIAVWVLSGAAVVYTLGWILHFALLTQPGPGFVWARPSGHLLRDVVEVHRLMLASNYGLTTPHPDSSPWWSWPLMLGPVFYWGGERAALYFIGNPIVWWGSALGLVTLVTNAALIRVTNLRHAAAPTPSPQGVWILLLGYALAFLPLTPVPRPLFLYHYLTPLLFGVCAVLLWLDRLGWTRPGGWARQRLSVHASVLALLLGFLAVSPLTFGFDGPPRYARRLIELLRALL